MKLLSQQRLDDAANACAALIKSHPDFNDAYLLLAKTRQQQGRFGDMLQLVETALSRDPRNTHVQLQFAGACQFSGQYDRALQMLSLLEPTAQNDATLLQQLAQLYVRSGQHAAAHRCYERALALQPDNPQFLNNLAASCIAMGDITAAENTYSRVIGLAPKYYDAWHNRSTLRKQTKDDNHIGKLERTLKKLPRNDAGETPLAFALAKELEDLGEFARSFSYLKRGADSVRRRISYDVGTDIAVMQRIAELYDADFVQNTVAATEQPGPIFILGLPRSGTTLVDRIVSSHSQVQSMGELTDFALALTRIGGTTDKQQLLETSVKLNFDALGKDYQRSVTSYGVQSPFFVDKTPTNFLYIGLIAKALPGAAIVHLRRHPVDSCLAMYRTLFRLGYPFSYNLDDLADYYIAYDALMRHWEAILPGKIFNVSYEGLVNEQESVSRDIVAHCGLEWENACLQFDKNAAPVTTASAVQVRRPMYRDALARWKHYADELKPLIERLDKAGIEI